MDASSALQPMPDFTSKDSRFVRRFRRAEPAEPLATEESLDALIERIRRSPLDGALCYELGVAMLRRGFDEDGLRYLDRAFRIDALNIVRFVQTPELKPIRLRDSVIRFLTRVRRDEEQRSYGGYA